MNKNGFPCEIEADSHCRIDPVIDLTEIGQFANADRDQLMTLVLWLAPSIRSCRNMDAEMVDRGPLAWVPARLETEKVEFDISCLETTVETHGAWVVMHKDSLTRIEREGQLMGTISQSRYRLLEAECLSRRIPIEYLCDSIPEEIAYVEKHESKRGFGSHQFWHGLRVALDSDGIVGCCPLMTPSSFPYSSWTGSSADWGSQMQPCRPVFDLLCASPEIQHSLSGRLRPDQVWFALSRRSTLDRSIKQELERAGQVITVYKKGSRVAACKGSFRTGKVRAIQNKEDWCLWASNAAIRTREVEEGFDSGGHCDGPANVDPIHRAIMEAQAGISGGTGDAAETARVTARLRRRADLVRSLKQKADSICLTADGVVPLDLGCLSSREARLGPAGAAYTRSGIVVATDGSLKKSGAMGAAVVAKDGRIQARSVAVFGQPSS
ncbi:MAG: hypothetical protein ACKOPU_06645, partial [Candidatus Planktophila sp.]